MNPQIRMNDLCTNFLASSNQDLQENILRPISNNISPLKQNNESNLFLSAKHNISLFNNSATNSPFVSKICSSGLYPLNTSHYDSGIFSNSISSNSVSSPCLNKVPTNFNINLLMPKPIMRFQSTPNKQSGVNSKPDIIKKGKTNFHSITDLARSSDASISLNDSGEHNQNGENMSSGYLSASNTSNSVTTSPKSLINNDFIKRFQNDDKENDQNREFIYKTKRRPRAQITKQQREILEYAYKLKCYPDSNEVEYLCGVLGHEENVIRIWFQNKRARNKTSRC